MRKTFYGVLATALLFGPAVAQNVMPEKSGTNPNGMTDESKTGVLPRGTKVAPSTNPAQANDPAAANPGATGVGERGGASEVAPSTSPAQPRDPAAGGVGMGAKTPGNQ